MLNWQKLSESHPPKGCYAVFIGPDAKQRHELVTDYSLACLSKRERSMYWQGFTHYLIIHPPEFD